MSQLVEHERIETTVQKAKELRRVADKVITWGKEVCQLSCQIHLCLRIDFYHLYTGYCCCEEACCRCVATG